MTNQQSVKESKTFENADLAMTLFGPNNQHLKMMEEELDLTINQRGNQLEFIGEEEAVQLGEAVCSNLYELLDKGIKISHADVLNTINMAKQGNLAKLQNVYEYEIVKDYNGKPIRPKNLSQYNYIQSVRKNDIVFGVGPAGTGKTYLAVAMAVAAMRKGEVKRIVLTRPAVEAGENLGFLPGDLKEKVDPYLRPLYDALYGIFGTEHTNRLMDRETIEVAPLAYMRGRTLDDAFVILDEAQNTTSQQMKMFLTRLGFGSKMIINGDISQIDLPSGAKSGLVHAERILKPVDGIGRIHFSAADVVRHPLVSKIIQAYDQNDSSHSSKADK